VHRRSDSRLCMTGYLGILAASVAGAIIDLTARTGKKPVDFPVDGFANRPGAMHRCYWCRYARWLRQPADGCSRNHEWFRSTRWVRRRPLAQQERRSSDLRADRSRSANAYGQRKTGKCTKRTNRAWFKTGSGTVVQSTLRAAPATVPDPVFEPGL
jgi:hypothetical protein